MNPKLIKLLMFASRQSLYLIFFNVLTMQLLLASNTNGQSWHKVQVSVEVKDAPVKEIFQSIEQQSDFVFLYGTKVKKLKKRLSLKLKEVSVAKVLEAVSKETKLSFKQINDNISVATGSIGELPQKKQKDIIISGKVTDAKTGDPLAGASVAIKEFPSYGGITAVDGTFRFSAPDESKTLLVSFISYQTRQIPIGNQASFNITLSASVSTLDEVMVIGYGTSSRKNLTGSVGKLSEEVVNNQPNTGFEQNIIGRIPGVNIQQTTGTPGGNVSIKIRGTGSISAGNEPLIVIDGFPVSDSHNSPTVQGSRPSNRTRRENPQNALSTLNPNDIQSVEVLKDASAAAIYGSRGANGVILITTKKGQVGKARFGFNSYFGVQRITDTYELMDAYTFAEQHYLSRLNAGTTAGFVDDYVPYLNDVRGLPSTDWQDALFRDALIESYDLSVRGGSENLNYYVSGGYFNQEGIIVGSGFERFSLRANLEGRLTDKVRLSLNLSPSFTQSDLVPAENPYFVDGVVNLALLAVPTDPIYNEDGSFNFNQNTAAGSGPFVNPIALAVGIDDELDQFRFLGNLKVDAELYDGLTFSTSFGSDINSFKRHYYRPSWIPVRGAEGPSNPSARNFSTSVTNWVSESTLNYDFSVGDHGFSTLLGFSAQKERMDRNGIFANNFPNDLVTTINAGTVTSGFSQIQEWSLLSYFTRVTYDYQGKYLVNLSLRRDGSSRFGNDTKYGLFPAVSVGWRLSDEDFFPENDLVNDLKFRFSIGQTGNFSIPNYGAIALLGEADYVFNNQPVNGLAAVTSPNADLSWEKTTMTNFGLDLSFLNSQFSLTADYFISDTEDLLINLPVPGSSGFDTSLQNIGEVRNQGFELGINGDVNLGPVKWNFNANIATVKNEVLSLGQSNEPIISDGGVNNTHITQVGNPIGSYYGYRVLGVFQNQQEVNSHPSLADAQPGDFRFDDVNGDGIINADDRTIIGDFFPDYTWGFSSRFEYKNFDFSFLIQGAQNFEVFHLAQRYLGSLQTFSNYRADIFRNSFFSEDDPGNGQVYRPNASPTNDNDAISSYHVEDGSYIRFRTITLGYTLLKGDKLARLPFNSLRIYATGQNLFTITDYPGYNPEVNMRPEDPLSQGEDYGTYPLAKSVVLGINLNF